MIKLLIFDLDGTLVDTSQDIANAINYAVRPFGIRPLSIEEIKSMVGSGITKLLQSLVPSENVSLEKEAKRPNDTYRFHETQSPKYIINRFFEHYSMHLLDNTSAYPNVKETLSKLENYKRVVVSNKREVLSEKVLEGTGLLQFFDLVLGSDSVSEKKPSPVPIYEVLKKLGISKNEAVIIGDSNFDIEAGKAAGIRIIAVTYGYRGKEALKDADFMINNFGELLKIIPRLEKQEIERK